MNQKNFMYITKFSLETPQKIFKKGLDNMCLFSVSYYVFMVQMLIVSCLPTNNDFLSLNIVL